MGGPFNYESQVPGVDLAASLKGGYQGVIADQVTRQQLARQLQMQQQADAALHAAVTSPSPQNFSAALLLNPGAHESIKAAHDTLDAATQKQDLLDNSAVYGYLQAGNGEAAKAVLQRRIAADQKAGRDTSDGQSIISEIDADPKGALGVVGLHLAAIMGPDKFTAAYKGVGDEARANAEEPAKIADLQAKPALTAAQTAEATASAAKTAAETENLKNPKPVTEAVQDGYGNVHYYNKNAPPPAEPLPSGVEDLAAAIEADENATGNPGAKNPRSNATGNGQFIPSTWLSTVRANRPDLAAGKSDAQILAMRSDPAISREMTGANAVVNAGALSIAGVPVNGATLAAAHKLGPGDAISVIQASQADGNTPLTSILSKKVIAANPQLAKQTAGQYVGALTKKFGVTPIDVHAQGENSQALTGDALDYVAQQYVATGQLPALGNGKIATINRDAIINRAAAIEKETGSTGYDAVARHQNVKAAGAALAKVTTLKNLVEGSERTVELNMDIVGKLAPKGAGPSGSPLLNTPIQYLRNKVWGSVDVANFNGAIGTVADEYAKVMSSNTGSGGVTSDSARKEAYERLSKAQTIGQLQGVMGVMKSEMANRSIAFDKQQSILTATIKNGGVAPKQQTADNIPTLNPQEAAKLPKGARFRTTDGRELVRQ